MCTIDACRVPFVVALRASILVCFLQEKGLFFMTMLTVEDRVTLEVFAEGIREYLICDWVAVLINPQTGEERALYMSSDACGNRSFFVRSF